MGAGPSGILRTVVMPEALGPLILGYTFVLVAIVDMTAWPGFIGGGGLGNFALRLRLPAVRAGRSRGPPCISSSCSCRSCSSSATGSRARSCAGSAERMPPGASPGAASAALRPPASVADGRQLVRHVGQFDARRGLAGLEIDDVHRSRCRGRRRTRAGRGPSSDGRASCQSVGSVHGAITVEARRDGACDGVDDVDGPVGAEHERLAVRACARASRNVVSSCRARRIACVAVRCR